MAIDYQDLKIKINTMRTIISNTKGQLAKAEKVHSILQSIYPDDALDTITNQPMTAARRQELYDSCLPVARELIEWGRNTSIPKPPHPPEEPPKQ